ncbi:2-amino-4-hydroxy-6-hydroxymethyldihydropteridine diphosphokinase [Pseudomonas citronellolis]|uniref:2-amino-4-hydroxy-6- hydroxymethyldihydropteridine diphosphokinase n=1 Tax=Pseudomonas citronellolis TaxID=53408 RepID=UPI00142896A9|nr:2-amino-4-hydroxy-6-hydroxymethyldihydropteridine diphosphokinase [Pseudomonas humi]
METQVFLGLGSNFGREANLSHALRSLAGELRQIRHSAVYESAALGGRGPDFLNLVVGGYTRLDPPGLVAWLKRLEAMCGRGFETEGMVALDIDLLLT